MIRITVLVLASLFVLPGCGNKTTKDLPAEGEVANEAPVAGAGQQENREFIALQEIAGQLGQLREAVEANSSRRAYGHGGHIAPLVPPRETASRFTKTANSGVSHKLPFDDDQDFVDARRGFLAKIPDGRILGDEGQVVWDLSRFAFLEGDAPSTVNPSLWRQAKLNMEHGLFEVKPGLYQVRGYDLAVMTVVEGDNGWIVIDPLLTKETAEASLALVNKTLGDRPVTAIIYTHSHADHFGGVRGVTSEEEIEKNGIRIIAPNGLSEEAIAENIIAGNAMGRRAQFQFGFGLEISATGLVDSGIGKGLAAGTIGFIEPTEYVKKTGEVLDIDGVEFIFVMAPDTEAPSEFAFYIPKFKAIHAAELATGTLHNVLTPRGAQVRNALAWSQAIQQLMTEFGKEADVVLASHNWPTWGQIETSAFLSAQRDLYRYIHDQTMRLANQGYTMHEIPPLLGEPEFMRREFSTRGYYGSVDHNSRATYQRYFGWWDGNPANLDPLPPVDEAGRLVELAGGRENMLGTALRYFHEGDYRWSAKLFNTLVFFNPEDQMARDYLAAAYEQLGFQAESAIFRNYYLSAAKELRPNGAASQTVNTVTEDFVRAVPTPQYFDALSVRLNPERANRRQSVVFEFKDTGEKIHVGVGNGSSHHAQSAASDDDAILVSLERADLDDITLGKATFQSKLAEGAITVTGETARFIEYLSVHDQFDPNFQVIAP